MSEAAAPEVLLWRGMTAVGREQFLREAASIAAQLPAGDHLVNLCEHREAFLLTFAAAIMARRTQLMPAARTEGALAELAAEYGQPPCVRDDDIQHWRSKPGDDAVVPGTKFRSSDPEEDWPVMIGFTSGSTGKSQPHRKPWRALAGSARLNSVAIRMALGVATSAPVTIVGTVPSHHMYGLELTVLLPLLANMSVHTERPLFPADVAAVLSQPARPRVLVSTPLHLRALAETDLVFPALDLIVSATAPLDATLARHIEARLGAPLLEMFGATETCVMATRRTAQEEEWRLYEGIGLQAGPDSTRVNAAWYPGPQRLQDVLEERGAGFVLRGRNSDLVEVAGKRASLADITRRLCAIAGVEDAVAFQPETGSGAVNRVAAVVVSRGVSARQIAEQLAASLDAVFVPRPLLLVPRIPRDAVGKVSREQLLELARRGAG
jgi:acyl-coenzyme A synthetase/AMP-(fatty) acid ligase